MTRDALRRSGDLVKKRRFLAGVFDHERHCEESSTKQSTFTDCSGLRLFGSEPVKKWAQVWHGHLARGSEPYFVGDHGQDARATLRVLDFFTSSQVKLIAASLEDSLLAMTLGYTAAVWGA
jgi:hypothetical protein